MIRNTAKEPCRCGSLLQFVCILNDKRSKMIRNTSMQSHRNVCTQIARISSLSQGSFAKETYNFKDPTNRALR